MESIVVPRTSRLLGALALVYRKGQSATKASNNPLFLRKSTKNGNCPRGVVAAFSSHSTCTGPKAVDIHAGRPNASNNQRSITRWVGEGEEKWCVVPQRLRDSSLYRQFSTAAFRLNDGAFGRSIVERVQPDYIATLIAPCLAKPSEIGPAIAKVVGEDAPLKLKPAKVLEVNRWNCPSNFHLRPLAFIGQASCYDSTAGSS